MYALFNFVIACAFFFAGLFGISEKPWGSDSTTTVSGHTRAFHLGVKYGFMPRLFCLIAILSIATAAIGAQYGAPFALATLLTLSALAAPKVSCRLGVATTIPIFTDERLAEVLYLPVAAATKIPAGVITCINTSGAAVNGADTAGLRVKGRAEETQDNTSGAAGDLSINVKRSAFKFANSVANAITAAMVGKQAYVEDNQTVASTSGNKVAAGEIIAIDADGGVWVDMRKLASSGRAGLTDSTGATAGTTLAAGAGITTLSIPVDLPSVGNADILSAYVPGYKFKVLGVSFAVNQPVTTGAKAATVTPKITGVAITGGVVGLTSANCTPMGALVAGSAITALNTGAATDSITITGSAVTTFVEGKGTLLIKIQNMDTADALASLAAA